MKILCLCSGNTCRSPMLMMLLRAELERAAIGGVEVESAGTGAYEGDPASEGALRAMSRRGLDLLGHRSRNAAQLDLTRYDLVLAMTSSHAAHARSRGVPTDRLAVANADGGGIPDPFGGGDAEYEHCAAVLETVARHVVAELPRNPAMTADPLATARAALDAAHAADPERVDGVAAELLYADRVEAWVRKLVPRPSAALALAARCQHLERWVIRRDEFPLDKAGYHAWRKAVQARQGQRAGVILAAAGCDAALIERVSLLVAKATPRGDAEAQTLEDAACLVFIAHELAGFAAEHPDYTREKFIDIIRKSWRKMSPIGQQLALGIPLPDALADLVKAAVSGA